MFPIEGEVTDMGIKVGNAMECLTVNSNSNPLGVEGSKLLKTSCSEMGSPVGRLGVRGRDDAEVN